MVVVLFNGIPQGGGGDRRKGIEGPIAGIIEEQTLALDGWWRRRWNGLCVKEFVQCDSECRHSGGTGGNGHGNVSYDVVRRLGDLFVRKDGRIGDEWRVNTLDQNHRARCFHGLQEEGVARRSAQLRGTGMVETVIEADGYSPGFMRRRQESCEHGTIPWTNAELLFAGRFSRDHDERGAD